MYQFIESIKVQNGILCNLEFHQNRLNDTLKSFYPDTSISLDKLYIAEKYKSGIFKLRLIYSDKIHKIEFVPYIMKIVKSLKIVHSDNFDYNFKFIDREIFDKLLTSSGDCDDIIIVQNGFITDSSYSNLVFHDGEKLITPSTPLLNGTKRQELLSKGIISAKEVKLDDIFQYESISLINCMLNLGDCSITTRNIIPE